jgi:uncharacterized RDD family membrane protein YckC
MASDASDLHVSPPPRAFLPSEYPGRLALLAGNYATFWQRLIAAVVDGFVLAILGAVFTRTVARLSIPDVPIVEVLYSIGFIAAGATPGMRALHIRVVDAEGNAPGIGRSMLRYLIPALSWVPGLFFFSSPDIFLELGIPVMIVVGAALTVLAVLDPLWMIWDPQKQMLHDKLASTYVVNDRASDADALQPMTIEPSSS